MILFLTVWWVLRVLLGSRMGLRSLEVPVALLLDQEAGGVLAGSGGSWALWHVAPHLPLGKMGSVVVSGQKSGESRPSAQGPAQIWRGSLLHRVLLVEVRPIPVDLGHRPSPPSAWLAWGGRAGTGMPQLHLTGL